MVLCCVYSLDFDEFQAQRDLWFDDEFCVKMNVIIIDIDHRNSKFAHHYRLFR